MIISGGNALVVGAGPNGLAAAIELARAGMRVEVREAAATAGGGLRTEGLTLPGFLHDVCAGVFPLAIASPFFSALELESNGLRWLSPAVDLAHPFDDGTVSCLSRSVADSAATLGNSGDSRTYRRLFEDWGSDGGVIFADLLAPLHWPRRPFWVAKFGLRAAVSVQGFVERNFQGAQARALFAGLAAHSGLALERAPSAAFAWVLAGAAHFRGWPIVEGGASRLALTLARILEKEGGRLCPGRAVESPAELASFERVIFDTSPEELVRLGDRFLPWDYVRRLNAVERGPGVFKLDWALSDPIPWAAEGCRRAGTLHLGASNEEIASWERGVTQGHLPEGAPFLILSQPSLLDPSRAPEGRHTAWAYCHVPRGFSDPSLLESLRLRVEAQVERFAPGFRDCILARSALGPEDFERHNRNNRGGDITGGVSSLWRLYFRPVMSRNPYRTPVPGWFLCSSSTPPGGGVHGMCGVNAARAALRGL